ncbi:hypothetical protein Tco_1215408 [Tanacetum coccineum]
MKTIIKDQVKAQVSMIMPKIEKYVTESLGAEVLVRSTNQPQTAYAVAALLLKFELKKILIDKMEANKSINRSDNQKNLYNALVESYYSDKDNITSYDRGTKRKKSGKDAESFKDSRYKEKKSSSTSKDASQSQHKSSGKSAHAEEPNLEYLKGRDLSKRDSTSVTKTKAATYELKWIEDLLHELWSPVVVKYDPHAYLGPSNWGPTRQSFYGYSCNLTSSKDFYSRRRIIAVTRLIIMKMYGYGHLEEIEVRRDDQQQYTFKEGYFKRLSLQDIEDMLLLLVQQKLTNLIIDEWYDLNVPLRMFTRCIVIQRRVEDLQLGVKSYQKKLNLTKPDTYRPNLRNKTAYTSYSDPHGIIYVDQFKRKRLMRTDELYKFSDGTLNDVQTALHDIAAGIRMEYLPMRKWSNLDKKRARVMVQDIDKQLYQRRLMRNLEMSILTDSKEYKKIDVEQQSVKVKELQDKRILKAFKLSYQEKYEHVGPKSQDHKMARLQDDVKEVKRANDKSYIFKESNYKNLSLNDIKDLYLLKVQDKLHHLPRDIVYDIMNSSLIYIRSLVIRKRVEDVQLGVESYQQKLNLTKPDFTFPRINDEVPYTLMQKFPGVMYQSVKGGNKFMMHKKVYKFGDGTSKKVSKELPTVMNDYKLGYITS